LKSTVAFFSLFLLLDLAFLFLACAYQNSDGEAPHRGLLRAGGAFGVLCSFVAWYNALAGLLDTSNR
jgi:uncharacterized protein